MFSMTIGGKKVSVFSGKTADAPAVYLNTFADEGAQVYAALHRQAVPDFSLVAIHQLDWNHDMTPWDAPPAFPHSAPCTGGADDYLDLLTGAILPAAEKALGSVPRWRGLAGYSLAGLFALYALYTTDVFSRFASVSGSLWYPGILEFATAHTPRHRPDKFYFSLGTKEIKTRNPLLQTVGQHTEAICAHCQRQGICTVLQWNPGNHYAHSAERTAAGIAWLLQE